MSEVSPETRLWDLLRGAMTTKALAVVADLRIADALAEGRRPVIELAEQNGANPDTLHRVLRALASDGVFAEDEPGVFRNTEASELLRRDGWTEFAHLFGSVFADAANTLDPGMNDETFTFDANDIGIYDGSGAWTRRWSTSAAATARFSAN